jgi:hypothetical protein
MLKALFVYAEGKGWPPAIVMLLAATVGGYVGAQIGLRA